ncbi:MAG: flagellar hook-basal body complex protein [Planctomycetota bacterium]
MASTTALFTGLSGLNANARRLDVIGNNISNVNTVGFKSNRMLFAPTFSRNFSLGTAPSGSSGGTNPGQIGLGVSIAGTQRNFNNGAIAATGVSTDLAIEGSGFFMVERAGERFFTRSGAFQTNSTNELVNLSGDRVQGYLVDQNFQIVENDITDLSIPVGRMTLAEATRDVSLSGNLDADGQIATIGSALDFGALTAGGAAIMDTTLLTAIEPAMTFEADDVISISGFAKGGKTLPDASFTVTATSTVADYATFVMDALGIVPDGGADPADMLPGGFAVDAGGVLTITGNYGDANDIDIASASFDVVDSTGAAKANPFSLSKSASAAGESVRTSVTVYDSLGTPIDVDLTLVLAGTDNTGTQWRVFANAADDTDLAIHLEAGDRGLGTADTSTPLLTFDSNGRISGNITEINLEIDRNGLGPEQPLNFRVAFDQFGDEVTAFSSEDSSLTARAVNGIQFGVLTSFSVGEDGVITGGFSNGLTRTIGQVLLATFTNDAGLIDVGDNLFRVGPNSGQANITEPLSLGSGRVIGGALEQANVDLGNEFIELIQTQTGYTAAARVVTTTDELLQQLLILGA